MVASTTARVRERTVTAVLPLLRPRFALAIRERDAPLCALRIFSRFPVFFLPPSVYRSASTGETFAAMRPGFAQERKTVARENSAAPTKIPGLKVTIKCP